MELNNFYNSYLFSELADEDAEELIPLDLTGEDDELDPKDLPDDLPILPLKNAVLFPGVVIPITVGRQKSIRLVKKAYRTNKIIGVAAQKNSEAEDPGEKEIYKVGTVAKILKMLVLPDGNTTIIIQGKSRMEIQQVVQENPYLTAKVNLLDENFVEDENKETVAIIYSLKDAAKKILKLNPEIPKEAQVALENINSYKFLTHFLSSNINSEVKDKQKLLEINDGNKRAEALLKYMLKDIQVLELKHEIHNKVNTDIDQQQRDYYLRQQMKVLQDELGHGGVEQEVDELRSKGLTKNWPEEVAQHFDKELSKIERMNPMAAEYPVAMNYAELLIELPWNDISEDNFDLKRAKKILDKDHFGLEKVKDRIIEYLAVRKLKNDLRGPILCLFGPPGVGKTSLGKSIAKALNREYVRMSLGGVHDEAEIRGHRKTYIGAMPGKVIQNINKAKTSNPVFVLDEIDKVSSDFRGDPSSALLEVLDPEQNESFKDNFLEVEYDLSKVLFIATANSLDTIQPALRDRMEIIQITGYTLEEKIQIAKKHLLPKQLEEHGMKSNQLSLDQKAFAKLVDDYTRESGVRNLERKIGAVVRDAAKSIAMEDEYAKKITTEEIRRILGAEVFDKELYQDNSHAGVVTGLAWTSVGGEILFIESSLSRGKGKLTLSGQLGDVMKESAMTALSYLKSNADSLNLDYRIFDNYDLHVHVPAGAVPKDGPSAGITMLTSLASVFTQRKVKQKLAMTGEITLRGKVLPVGGIKEKILAAKRAGIKEIILCQKNKNDIDEIDERYLKGLEFHFAETVNQVLEVALLPQKVKNALKLVTFEKKEA
ncbi:MAG: endopeptidase La [Reichenbachiella sp.]|uniref:endopeptidase La n=1 Tax=Reichenbachiella sp. TaxID=2184521 RepID=UPI00326582C9